MESSLYEGLAGLFPQSYSSGGYNKADSGKLLVLSDLLTSIRQLSPSDRCVSVFASELFIFLDYYFYIILFYFVLFHFFIFDYVLDDLSGFVKCP